MTDVARREEVGRTNGEHRRNWPNRPRAFRARRDHRRRTSCRPARTLICGSAGRGKTLAPKGSWCGGDEFGRRLLWPSRKPPRIEPERPFTRLRSRPADRDGKIVVDYVHVDRGEIDETASDLEDSSFAWQMPSKGRSQTWCSALSRPFRRPLEHDLRSGCAGCFAGSGARCHRHHHRGTGRGR
jgi:hypothetical protein